MEEEVIHLVDKRLMCKARRVRSIVGFDDIESVTCNECLEFAVEYFEEMFSDTRRKLYKANMRLRAIKDEQRRASKKSG